MIKFILLILIIILLFIYIIFPAKIAYQGPRTDHFDGKHFHNNTITDKKTFIDVFKWWFSREKQIWPIHVNNIHSVKVNEVENSNQIKITFVNHSTVLIQTKELNLLTDPIWSKRASPFSWLGPLRVREPGVSFDNLPKIDVVLVSHNHYDHLDQQTLIRLNEKFHPIFFVPLGNKLLLNRFGITNVIELDWWQTSSFKNLKLTFLPTQHWSARWINDRNLTLWGSFGIELLNKKIYFAGDAGYSSYFKEIKTKWYEPDLSLLPIGAYLPRWFMQYYHMMPSEAVKAHLDLGSKKSIAIHYGTFQMSDEGFDQPVKDLQHAIKAYSLPENAFILLPEGKGIVI